LRFCFVDIFFVALRGMRAVVDFRLCPPLLVTPFLPPIDGSSSQTPLFFQYFLPFFARPFLSLSPPFLTLFMAWPGLKRWSRSCRGDLFPLAVNRPPPLPRDTICFSFPPPFFSAWWPKRLQAMVPEIILFLSPFLVFS